MMIAYIPASTGVRIECGGNRMTLGHITIFWGLPITAGCGCIIALNHYGLTRCLQAMAAALWAAAIAYDEGKRIWRNEYRTAMRAAIGQYGG
jgi:hypothetical protein